MCFAVKHQYEMVFWPIILFPIQQQLVPWQQRHWHWRYWLQVAQQQVFPGWQSQDHPGPEHIWPPTYAVEVFPLEATVLGSGREMVGCLEYSEMQSMHSLFWMMTQFSIQLYQSLYKRQDTSFPSQQIKNLAILLAAIKECNLKAFMRSKQLVMPR